MDVKINLHPTIDKNAEFFCVDYPGYVFNTNKMLATLGGSQHIAEIHADFSKRLDLKFRPDDPCCKPICADKVNCTSLLLKVSKYKRKKSSGEDEFMYRQHICGVAKTIYSFNSLCDYQYLPLQKDSASNEIKNMIPNLKIDESALKNPDVFSQDVPLFLPPPTYGRLDTPFTYQYRKNRSNYKKSDDEVETDWNDKVSTRKDRPHHCILVRHDDKVPTQCLPTALKVYNEGFASKGSVKEKLKKAFDERPIWSRNALLATIECGAHTLKHLLPVIAYYMITGPWARLWVRFGYDPKLHPEAKMYQLIDFRLRRGMHDPHIMVKAKRSTFNYKLPHLSSKSRYQAKSPASYVCNPASKDESQLLNEKKRQSEATYLYKPGILPGHRQIYYQLCDISLSEVEEMINKTPPSPVSCNKDDGWLPPNFITEVRSLISKDIHKTLSTSRNKSSLEVSTSAEVGSATDQDEYSGIDLNSPLDDSAADKSDQDEEIVSSSSSDSSADEESMAGQSQEDILTEDVSGSDGDDSDDPNEVDVFDDVGLYLDDEDEQLICEAGDVNSTKST